MDLFDYMREQNQEKEAPLASRLRPRTLDEVVGQQHIIGKGRLLYRAIKADQLTSIIFYGPPGTGKTTLAKVIANTTSAEFKQINGPPTIKGPVCTPDQIRIIPAFFFHFKLLFCSLFHLSLLSSPAAGSAFLPAAFPSHLSISSFLPGSIPNGSGKGPTE